MLIPSIMSIMWCFRPMKSNMLLVHTTGLVKVLFLMREQLCKSLFPFYITSMGKKMCKKNNPIMLNFNGMECGSLVETEQILMDVGEHFPSACKKQTGEYPL